MKITVFEKKLKHSILFICFCIFRCPALLNVAESLVDLMNFCAFPLSSQGLCTEAELQTRLQAKLSWFTPAIIFREHFNLVVTYTNILRQEDVNTYINLQCSNNLYYGITLNLY